MDLDKYLGSGLGLELGLGSALELRLALLGLHRPSLRHKDTHEETDMRSIGDLKGWGWGWGWSWSWGWGWVRAWGWDYWGCIDRASDTRALARRLT